MPDTNKLRNLVNDYVFRAKPVTYSFQNPCTAEDLERVIQCTAELLNAFIDELEEIE